MKTYIVAVVIILAMIGAGLLWFNQKLTDAETRGVDQQVARDVAIANQEIGEMRVRDAKFDKMDARQHCLDADLDWVFEDGKSFCR